MTFQPEADHKLSPIVLFYLFILYPSATGVQDCIT